MLEPSFVQRAPWWGGHLQTVRNLLLRDMADLSRWPAERLTVATQDGSGDLLLGTLQRGSGASGVLVVLFHGLTGCEDSAYMLHMAAALLRRGHGVLRMNLRGAGPSRLHCRHYYHAGRTEDARAVFAALPASVGTAGVAAVGFSLGGNLLLKYLAEEGRRAVPFAAASVSAPINLALAAHCFHRPRNWPYRRWLLARMRREVLAGDGVSAPEARAVRRARSIVEFDERFTAPRNGFRDAADYYEKSSAQFGLADIATPTLMVHAIDDPWVPSTPYDAIALDQNPHLIAHITRRGGHVGFHGRGDNVPWYAGAFATFVERCAGQAPQPRQAMAFAASTAK